MKQKTMTLKKLRTLVETGLRQGFTLAFFLPDAETRPPTWQEVRQAAMDGYGLALGDVLEAIDGDTEGLEQARSKDGRIAIKEEDWSRYEELVGKDSGES
jgi:hypothetical protein